MFDVTEVRKDFPILEKKVNGQPLIYFDNAASNQKPKIVVDSLVDYYFNLNSNVHRGVHYLSQKATDAFEKARLKTQKYLNAKHSFEVIFTKGTTDSINIVASGYTSVLKKNDVILVSEMEHHSNIVPWQFLKNKTGVILKVIPMKTNSELDLEAYDLLLKLNPKLVVCSHISNALGIINPVKEIIDRAHRVNAKVLIDGAQFTPHAKPDVQVLDVDYYVFSSHKMCGPTGVGVLYGKEDLLNKLPPYQGGGEMINEVSFEKTTYADLPHKFEAGTPNIAGVIAFGIALDYLMNLSFEAIGLYEKSLFNYLTDTLNTITGIDILGNESKNRMSLNSFIVKGIHAYDIGIILNQMGIAVRTGHHCAQPIMKQFEIAGTIRASISFYNSIEEMNRFASALRKAIKMLS